MKKTKAEKRLNVIIVETLERKVVVSTTSEEEAINLVREQYNNEEIVLDSNDYATTEYDIYEDLKK